MTRLFLEIKNTALCAEQSFFILLYFLWKNLLFLCAEHHYPYVSKDTIFWGPDDQKCFQQVLLGFVGL